MVFFTVLTMLFSLLQVISVAMRLWRGMRSVTAAGRTTVRRATIPAATPSDQTLQTAKNPAPSNQAKLAGM